MKDWEIMLAEYLGTEFAQSITAEVGEDVVKAIWLDGYNNGDAITSAELISMSARIDALDLIVKGES